MVDLRLLQAAHGEGLEQVVQDHAVQGVDLGPAQLARHHPAHGRLVAGAPGQRKGVAVDPGVQRINLARHAAVPVDHSPKHIKREDLVRQGVFISHGGLSVVMAP